MLYQDTLRLIPELVLAGSIIFLLMYGVFSGDGKTRSVVILSFASLVAVAYLVFQMPGGAGNAFADQFQSDNFTRYAKLLVLLGSGACMLMSMRFIERMQMNRFEFPILFLFATLGMMMMVSANDLMSLYMGLELQSLALYVAAAFRRDTLRSTEAGLKYFVLGALSSGMLLYGISLVYGFVGTTNFDQLATAIAAIREGEQALPMGLIFGLVFVAAGLAFKVSAVPFHMWTPDVYEGAPTIVTAFFATAPKIAALTLFIRVMSEPFAALTDQWQQILVFISLASMLLGAFAALSQSNIKRLMAYSSIGHVGYALVGLAAGTQAGVEAILVYITIYLIMTIGTFGCILAMRRDGRMVETITDLAGLSKSQPLMALALCLFMFSMAGIPPLLGFWGKWYVFAAALDAGLTMLVVVGVLASVVGAFYYIRIIKIMYFDEAAEPFDGDNGIELNVIVGLCAIAVVGLFIFLGPIENAAKMAANAISGG
jgi:NADH-quinone oxidoreductase subunit N